MTIPPAPLEALDAPSPATSPGLGGAWADGFGIVAPDVVRYAQVLRSPADPVTVAMRSLAAMQRSPVPDDDTLTLLSLLVHVRRPDSVLEVGTGIGCVTVPLARAASADCTLASVSDDPELQEHAHAFLARAGSTCAPELRLGDPLRLLREGAMRTHWDMVVLSDPALPRLDVLDLVAPQMAADALLVVPWALQGGRVASSEAVWNGDHAVEQQRLFNRCVATDPRFADVTLLPVGDGLLLARRA